MAVVLTELDEDHIRAGGEYLRALRTLGLDPAALFWAQDQTVGGHVLVLVTAMFDFAGPLVLSQTLFKAYETSATPREIDPFIIRLHSPRQAIIRELAVLIGKRNPWMTVLEAQSAGDLGIGVEAQYNQSDLAVRPEWIYTFDLGSDVRQRAPIDKRWDRYLRNVGRLAA